jgi:uncharacterized protein (DUF3084 family)
MNQKSNKKDFLSNLSKLTNPRMKYRETKHELSELITRIRQIENGNQVVIERYKSYNISLSELKLEYEQLHSRFEKRFGYLSKRKTMIS